MSVSDAPTEVPLLLSDTISENVSQDIKEWRTALTIIHAPNDSQDDPNYNSTTLPFTGTPSFLQPVPHRWYPKRNFQDTGTGYGLDRDHAFISLLTKDEIQTPPKGDFVRLGLHRQIEIINSEETLCIIVTMRTEEEDKGYEETFQADYFELGSGNFQSSTGVKESQVTLASMKEGPQAIPFTVYQTVLTAPADKEFTKSGSLKTLSTLFEGLVGYYGLGVFHRVDQSRTSDKDEIYFISRGTTIEIYSTSGNWSRLRRLDFGIELNASSLLTKPLVTLSPDCFKTAITANGDILLHEIFSGIRLGVFKDDLPEHNLFTVVFEKDFLLIENATLSTLEYLRPNYRSVVRIEALTTSGTELIHQDYQFAHPQAPGVLTSQSSDAVVNFKRFPGVLPPAEEDKCGQGDGCESKQLGVMSFTDGFKTKLESSDGSAFFLGVAHSVKDITMVLKIGVGSNSSTGLREENPEYAAFREIRNIFSAHSCMHGKSIRLQLGPRAWSKMDTPVYVAVGGPDDIATATVPITLADIIGTSQQQRLDNCHGRAHGAVPSRGLKRMGRVAHIPVKQRTFIINNHELALPTWHYWRFWNSATETVTTAKDPVMQFKLNGSAGDPYNNSFTQEVFMAHFDALWHYKDEERVVQEDQSTLRTSWWATLFHMFLMKCHLRMPAVVECYNFNLDFFDNPAIAALVAYKWNTIGFPYWAVRFNFQCVFYTMVVTASLIQVYDPQPGPQIGLFIAIIVAAVLFLWLELLQAIHSWSRYAGSTYNVLDVIVFGLPLAASIQQLVLIYSLMDTDETKGNTSLLSFAILAVLLHMMFELRINKSVCKYVTIIQQAVVEIRAFYIFAGGLLAFAIAILHLLRARPIEGCERESADFPRNFFGALSLSASYFFMGGRYDPVLSLFENGDWEFHIMMIVFFFTVIVMLNVLIALINAAFTKGDNGWRLAWIEARLRYIESAENMSYLIPGFRKTHNVFPKQFYFTATKDEVKEYRRKYFPKKKHVDDVIAKKMGWGYSDDAEDEDEDEDENKNYSLDSQQQQQEQDTNANVSSETLSTSSDGDKKTEDVQAEETLSNDSGENEDKGDIDEVAGSPLSTAESAILQELRSQVGDLQKQLATQSEQFTLQQQQAEKQFQELKELLFLRASSVSS
ncbi:hypothetical protein BGX23_011573 [Mortierella sp. AD031]|nr:hypothetical protein BGX23_011573 [Mortierella sp. AD031]